jgi:hypothetical protein
MIDLIGTAGRALRGKSRPDGLVALEEASS